MVCCIETPLSRRYAAYESPEAFIWAFGYNRQAAYFPLELAMEWSKHMQLLSWLHRLAHALRSSSPPYVLLPWQCESAAHLKPSISSHLEPGVGAGGGTGAGAGDGCGAGGGIGPGDKWQMDASGTVLLALQSHSLQTQGVCVIIVTLEKCKCLQGAFSVQLN